MSSADLVARFGARGGRECFEAEIIRRAEGQIIRLSRDFFFHMNPLYGTASALRYILGRYEPAFDVMRRLRPRRVLEVGGAQGLSAWLMTSYAEEVVALDIVEERTAVGRALFPEVTWITGDWREHLASVPDSHYDMIVCSYGPVVWDDVARAKCKLLLHVGYRTRSWAQALGGGHKVPGEQISFSTTLAGGGVHSRRARGYVRYFFRRNWLKEAWHAVRHRYALPL